VISEGQIAYSTFSHFKSFICAHGSSIIDVMSTNVCLINEAEGRDQSNGEDDRTDQ